MSWKTILLAAVITLPAVAHAKTPQITGEYLESRTADVYTGPCIANSEANLTGQEAILAWHVDNGQFEGVSLDGLSVVAVVRANNTLGDPYTNPLPAKTEFLVDQNADATQQAALVRFAQAQTGELLNDVVGVSVVPISLQMGAMHDGMATLHAGNYVHISTRALEMQDMICGNEETFYPPLAGNLSHAMPAYETDSTYEGKDLGMTWSDSGRRSAFLGMFAAPGTPD
jgi:hypothetical protein